MSRKSPSVLGNDPFRRGAARRAEEETSGAGGAGAEDAQAETPKDEQAPARKAAPKKPTAGKTAAKKATKKATKKTPARKKTSQKKAAEKAPAGTSEKKAAAEPRAEKARARKPAAERPAKKAAARAPARKRPPAARPEAEPEATLPVEPALPAEPEAAGAPEAELRLVEPEARAEAEAPAREDLPPWLRTGSADTYPETDYADYTGSRARHRRLERVFAEMNEAQDVLGKAVAAAGMGGAAVLEVGEELAKTVTGLEKALRSLLGPGLAAEVQQALLEVAELARRGLMRSPARRWGVPPARTEYDEFGRDPELEARLRPLFHALFETYFRTQTVGIENVPAEGPCVLVCNHAGGLPYDGPMVKTAIELRHPSPRPVRFLMEDFVFHAPFLGTLLNRYGGVRACPENAERLLSEEALVAVFPEGMQGLGKLFRQRYQLQRFGRGGFVKLCLRTGTPLVPVAIVGAEEIHPILFKVRILVRSLGIPYVPVTPTFPILGPLGLLPLPARWTIQFGEPIDLSHYGPEAANDRILVNRLSEQVRSRIQTMVDALLEERRSVFFR